MNLTSPHLTNISNINLGHKISETLFNKVKRGATSVLPKISLFSQKLKDTKVVDLAKKGFHIVKDELRSNPSKRKQIEYEPSPAATRTNVERSTVTDITVVPPKQSPLNKKWEAFKEKMRRHPMFKCVSGLSEPVVNKSQEILHISEVEVRETKMMGDIPLIIVQFQTQQVHCVRDRVGAIVEGSQDTINMVHYLWAMAQMDVEEAGEGALFPIWRLWDMQQVGIRALI